MTARNQHGVANSCDQYRTIDGLRWNQWASCLTSAVVNLYKRSGVRCRYIKNELYVHPHDVALAGIVSEQLFTEANKS